jgi:hypothetical protein
VTVDAHRCTRLACIPVLAVSKFECTGLDLF